MAALAELQQAQTMNAMGPDADAMQEWRAMSDRYNDMLGRARFEFRFESDGLTIDHDQSFR